MNKNEVILVNEQDEILGYMDKMEAHKKGLLHRAISVFIFNSDNHWLIQQRAEEKYHSGLKWSNTACTHPMKNETELESAKRRLKQEMGMKAELTKILSFQYKAFLDNELVENEFDHVFVGYTDTIPKINPKEVSNFRYISTENLEVEMKNSPEIFSEWFKILFKKIKNEIKK